MENAHKVKGFIAGLSAFMTTLWGWFGWLVLLFVACLVLDYLTGTLAAAKSGDWESKRARTGLWHKAGSITAVMCAGIADLVLGLAINNIPHISLPFTYEVVLCPVVIVWYIFTELGSIIENSEKLGAPIPPFLHRFIAVCKKNTEKAGDIIPDKEQSDE